jgi:hypothetical protein
LVTKNKLLSSLGNVKAELPLSTPTCTHFAIGCIDHSYTIKLTYLHQGTTLNP